MLTGSESKHSQCTKQKRHEHEMNFYIGESLAVPPFGAVLVVVAELFACFFFVMCLLTLFAFAVADRS